jgi:hypothetical protein
MKPDLTLGSPERGQIEADDDGREKAGIKPVPKT